MKLYNLAHSPYASRVRMQLLKKSLDVEIAPPPVALRTEAFNARFPMGKLPVLELDDGSQIAESWIIMEYLEDVFPENALRPADPFTRAQMGMLARCADSHLGPGGLFPMFAGLMAPGQGADKAALVAGLNTELARLERLLSSQGSLSERALHLGDIALVPHMAYVFLVAPAYGVDSPLDDYPAVSAWWQWVQEDDAVAATTQEMQQAFQTFMADKK